MARQRERFERTDVPKGGPYTNLIGAVVCLVSLAAAAGIGWMVWNYASLESRLEDSSLESGVYYQASTYVPDGYVETTDEVSCYLLLTASSLDAEGATLSAARILSVNATQGTAALVNVPLDVALPAEGGSVTLSEAFSSQGAAACVTLLSSASNVYFSHVVLATGDVLADAAGIAGASEERIVTEAADLLSQIRTDMGPSSLLSFAQAVSSVGASSLTAADAPLVAETVTDEEGNVSETGRQSLDAVALCAALGTVVTPA